MTTRTLMTICFHFHSDTLAEALRKVADAIEKHEDHLIPMDVFYDRVCEEQAGPGVSVIMGHPSTGEIIEE